MLHIALSLLKASKSKSGVVLVVAFTVASATWKVADWKHSAELRAGIERTIKQMEEQHKEDMRIAFAASDSESRVNEIYRDIGVKADALDDLDCTINDAIARLWNEANEAAFAKSSD